MNVNFKKIYDEYGLLLKNFSYLSILQFVNLLIPLIIFPYLIRVLGKELYGLILFSQVIGSYFIIIINYGFNISATKDVSINRNNKIELAKIITSVYIIKFMIFIFCFFIFIFLVFIIDKLNQYKFLYYLSFLTTLGEVLFPVWYFQGIEKMRYITLINVFSKIFLILLIFIVVKGPADYLYVQFFYFLGSFFAGIIATYVLIFFEKNRFVSLDFNFLKKYFVESFPFFLSRISGVIINQSSSLIIGIYSGMGDVSSYELSRRIVNFLLIPFNIINQTIYPNVARSKNIFLVKRVIKFVFISTISIFLIILVFSDEILVLFGGSDFLNTRLLLIILSLTIPIISISYFYGNTVLVIYGYYKDFNRSVIYSTLIYILIILLIIYIGFINLYIFAVITLISCTFELFYRIYKSKKYLLI